MQGSPPRGQLRSRLRLVTNAPSCSHPCSQCSFLTLPRPRLLEKVLCSAIPSPLISSPSLSLRKSWFWRGECPLPLKWQNSPSRWVLCGCVTVYNMGGKVKPVMAEVPSSPSSLQGGFKAGDRSCSLATNASRMLLMSGVFRVGEVWLCCCRRGTPNGNMETSDFLVIIEELLPYNIQHRKDRVSNLRGGYYTHNVVQPFLLSIPKHFHHSQRIPCTH